jgi:hypothetical protein
MREEDLMTRFLAGMFTVSLLLLAWHVKIRHIVYRLFKRGDSSDWGHVCKQPTYRHMTGRMANE